MAANYTIDDLVDWDKKIREKVDEFGLACFPQEFELCDHTEMLGYMAAIYRSCKECTGTR